MFLPNICSSKNFKVVYFCFCPASIIALTFFVCLLFFFFSLLLSYVFADGELKFNYFIVEVKSCFQDGITKLSYAAFLCNMDYIDYSWYDLIIVCHLALNSGFWYKFTKA